MKAVVWRGDRTLEIETVEDARLEAPTDVVMRVTSSAICGTDLHIYEGRMGEVDGMVIGHEPLGVAAEVGSAVVSIRKGDRVVVPTHICCGFCYNLTFALATRSNRSWNSGVACANVLDRRGAVKIS